MWRITLRIALTVLLGTLALASGSPAQEAAPEAGPALAIAAIHVEPAKPAADTLCRLRVEIANKGDRTASQFGFTVKINGKELPVYKNHLFMFPLPAQTTSELPLYNFWSTETSRPVPSSGKLEIEVTLREARWFDISTEGDTETWSPVSYVEGLPATRSIVVPMAGKSSP